MSFFDAEMLTISYSNVGWSVVWLSQRQTLLLAIEIDRESTLSVAEYMLAYWKGWLSRFRCAFDVLYTPSGLVQALARANGFDGVVHESSVLDVRWRLHLPLSAERMPALVFPVLDDLVRHRLQLSDMLVSAERPLWEVYVWPVAERFWVAAFVDDRLEYRLGWTEQRVVAEAYAAQVRLLADLCERSGASADAAFVALQAGRIVSRSIVAELLELASFAFS